MGRVDTQAFAQKDDARAVKIAAHTGGLQGNSERKQK